MVTITILAGLAQILGVGLVDLFRVNAPLQKAEILRSRDTTARSVERLIQEIQSNLYDDDKLPYVLTLCNDLCNLTGLSEKYGKWLRLELADCADFDRFRDEFGDAEAFNTWMNQWAPYRMIQTHIKFQYRSAESGHNVIDSLPYRSLIVGYSIPELVKKIRSAQERHITELAVPLRNLSQDYYSELQSFLAENPVAKLEMPRDVAVFFRVADLKKILVGIRKIVLSLLDDVRQKGFR
jgi:hypothetical protein